MFNTLAQGKTMLHANKLSNSSVLFPQNVAPGKGSIGNSSLQYINDIKSAANEITGALKEMSGANAARTAVSSNTDVLTASISPGWQNNMGSMSVRVSQVATGQVNEGAGLQADAEYEGGSGTFSIQQGNITRNFNITAREGETNQEAQQRAANAINEAGMGIRATVEIDEENNTSTLRLESENTGNDPSRGFTVRDEAGNVASQLGITEVTEEGQNAIFSVNGGADRTSQSNTVYVGNGVTATFNSASDEAVNITQGRQTGVSQSAVESLVQGVNNLFSAASQNTSDPKAQGLASRVMNIFSANSTALSEVGIGFTAQGRLSINSDRLNSAFESGRAQDLFGGNQNFGFAAQLGRLADQVTNSTSTFVTSSLFGQNTGGNNQNNIFNTGSLFDFTF